jgi:hypothetical protein
MEPTQLDRVLARELTGRESEKFTMQQNKEHLRALKR